MLPLSNDLVKHFDECLQDEILMKAGYDMIKAGRASVLILAGGQGTRLGWAHPKGVFVLPELPSGKAIFQILIEKFHLAQMQAHGVTELSADVLLCTMFIMTSDDNHEETIAYFEENKYFGGPKERFVFFIQ